METEEVVLKLGADVRGLHQGVEEAKHGMEEMREKAHEFGVHAESKGRAFHKVLHEISTISPVMGLALKAALDPVVAGFSAGILVYQMFEKAIEKVNEALKEEVELQTKAYMRQEEAASRAAELFQKEGEAYEQWKKKHTEGKPGEEFTQQTREKIDEARDTSNGEEEFLARKEKIERDAAKEAEEREHAALRAAEFGQGNNRDKLEQMEVVKSKLKEVFGEEEKARKDLATVEQEIELKGSSKSRERRRDDLEERTSGWRELRKTLEAESQQLERELKAQSEALKENQATADTAKKQRLDLDHEASVTAKQARDEERKAIEEMVKLHQEETEKARLKHFEQLKFDRDLSDSRRRRKEQENAAFLPTLHEIAKSGMWDSAGAAQDQFQRQADAFRMRSGMGYAAQFAQQAQELERTEADAKRALFLEGPESARFKDDKKRIDSLKKGLSDAGLQRPDDRLESIDKHIADLLDKASKDGLIVQPVNGA